MVQFAGIVKRDSRDNLSIEVQKMLSIMSLPKKEVHEHLVDLGSCLLGQTEQPFVSTMDHNYFIGTQGSIYNLPQLKQDLIDHGQLIESDTQENLLILAYQTWGPDFLSRVDGRFVLYIYDKRTKRLLLGRDKIGSHRIYWGRINRTFLFTSSLKGLLASKYVPQRPCMESIAAYFYLGYFPQDKTPIQNLNCLLPGYYLIVDEDINITLNKYWTFQTHMKRDENISLEEVSHNMDQLLYKAFEKRNPNKDPFHCYLHSGDIGSTSVAYYANKISPGKVNIYANEFEGDPASFMPHLDHVTQKFALPFEKGFYKPADLFSELSEVVWHLDEPIADPGSILIWNIAKKLKGKTSSIFTSLGFSECLGLHPGNTSLFYEPLFTWFLQLASPAIVKFGIPLISKMSKSSALSTLRFFQRDFWALEYLKQNSLFEQKLLKKIAPDLYTQFDFGTYIQQTYQYLKYIHSQNFDLTDYLFYDAETTLSNFLLMQNQNLFESQGITLFAPYLDMDLFVYLLHTPESLKSRRKKPALPLQQILKDSLDPADLGYIPPQNPKYLARWLEDPQVREVFSLLAHGTLAESGIISEKGFLSSLEQIKLYNRPFEKLWGILVLEVWFKLFVNRPVHTYPTSDPLVEYLQVSER